MKPRIIVSLFDREAETYEFMGVYSTIRDLRTLLTQSVRNYKGKSRFSDYPNQFDVIISGTFDPTNGEIKYLQENQGSLADFIVKDKSDSELYNDILSELSVIAGYKSVGELRDALLQAAKTDKHE